jgi:hypothetical protein
MVLMRKVGASQGDDCCVTLLTRAGRGEEGDTGLGLPRSAGGDGELEPPRLCSRRLAMLAMESTGARIFCRTGSAIRSAGPTPFKGGVSRLGCEKIRGM